MGYGCYFKISRVVEGADPYGFCAVFDILFVGDDVLGVPFIKMSLCFARAVGDACPYNV